MTAYMRTSANSEDGRDGRGSDFGEDQYINTDPGHRVIFLLSFFMGRK